MSTISLVYLSEALSDKDFMETSIRTTELSDPISNLDSSIDKRTSRIMFKMKKYYMIYIWNGRSLEFNMSEIVVKNILIYKVFDKENWEQKAKKCDYRYLDQISENWKDKIQKKQFIIQEKKDLKYIR